MTLYTHTAIQDYLESCYNRGADVWSIAGSLVDNYIIEPTDTHKGAVIKEIYLNEWSSAQSIRLYNELPAKYNRVIDLLTDGDEEAAAKIFFN